MLKLGIKPGAGRALALSLAVSAALAPPGRAWAGDGGPAWPPPQADGAAAPAAAGPAPALVTPGVAAAATVATPATAGATTVVAPAVAPAVASAGAAAGGLVAPLAAGEGGAPPAVAPCQPAAPVESAPFALAALAPERLERMRGGADAVWNDMKLNGAVSGNTAVNVATGGNIITNGSFSSASGLPIAIQNSGANVLIQNATIVNVQLR